MASSGSGSGNGIGSTQERRTISGVVAAVTKNGSGFKLEGRDGWLNISKFAPSVTLPARGAPVKVTLDGQGYVRAIDLDRDLDLDRDRDAPPPASTPSSNAKGDSYGGNGYARQQTITRLAVINSAISLLTLAGAPATPDDVLRLAATFEQWATR